MVRPMSVRPTDGSPEVGLPDGLFACLTGIEGKHPLRG